jgi:hypothetical protein
MTVTKDTQQWPEVIATGGHNILGGLSRVFHCNHYNAYLQMAVLLTQYIPTHEPQRLLTDAVTPLILLLKQQGYSHRTLLEEFSYCGFGILTQLDDKTWETPSSHYGQALSWHGKPEKSCYFNCGYIQGLVGTTVVETECQVKGAAVDKFMVLVQPVSVANYLNRDFELQTQVPERFEVMGGQVFNTRVDEAQIISTVRTLPLYGKSGANETGLIDAFGVVLTNHFADYYNRISYETYFAMRQAGMPEDESKEMFIQAGHICAFNTFGGIMSSPEWYALVAPLCDTREDWLHGMIAVINVLGWGIFRIEKIDVEQEFIVRVYNSYEGVGYRRMYPVTTDKNISFLGMGAVLGLVHLLWKVDIRERPALTQEFYVKQFNNPDNSYSVAQTHAIAAGDEFDRFVVSK